MFRSHRASLFDDFGVRRGSKGTLHVGWTGKTTGAFLPVPQSLVNIELSSLDGCTKFCRMMPKDSLLPLRYNSDLNPRIVAHAERLERAGWIYVQQMLAKHLAVHERLCESIDYNIWCQFHIWLGEKTLLVRSSLGNVLVWRPLPPQPFSAKQPLWIFDSLKL